MTEQPREPTGEDRDFERFLERSDPVSRAYGALGEEQPDTDLDAWIHTKARHSLRADPLRKASRRGWLYPVALAATLVLTVSVVLELQRQAKQASQGPPRPAVLAAQEDQSVAVDIIAEQPKPQKAERDARAAKPASRAQDLVAGREAKLRRSVPPPQVVVEPDLPAELSVTAKRNETLAAKVADDLAPLIAVIRARLVPVPAGAPTAASALRQDADKRAGSSSGRLLGESKAARPAQSGENALREILRLYEAGEIAGARAALAKFRQDFPEDPLAKISP